MSQREAQKLESRSNILKTAAGLLREQGVTYASVERAMKGAGLTVGAFYAHFADKAELIDQSFALALDEIGRAIVEQAGGRTGVAPLRELVGFYLSEGHRDHPRMGCPMPAVSADAVGSKARSLHQLVAQGLTTLAGRVEAVGGGAISADRALAVTVVMIAGQVLARATKGTPLSARVLSVTRSAADDLLTSKGAAP